MISYSIDQGIQCLFLSSWMHWLNLHVVLLKIEYFSSHSVTSLQHWSNDQISIWDISWCRYCSFFWRVSKELDSCKLCRTHNIQMTKKFVFLRISQIFEHFEYISMSISDFTDRLLHLFHCSLFISIKKLNISMTINALEVNDCCMKETSSSCMIQSSATRIISIFLILMNSVEVTIAWTFSVVLTFMRITQSFQNFSFFLRQFSFMLFIALIQFTTSSSSLWTTVRFNVTCVKWNKSFRSWALWCFWEDKLSWDWARSMSRKVSMWTFEYVTTRSVRL